MNENSYRSLAVVIFLAGAAISMYFRRRADRQSGNEKISLKAEGLPMMLALRMGGVRPVAERICVSHRSQLDGLVADTTACLAEAFGSRHSVSWPTG